MIFTKKSLVNWKMRSHEAADNINQWLHYSLHVVTLPNPFFRHGKKKPLFILLQFKYFFRQENFFTNSHFRFPYVPNSVKFFSFSHSPTTLSKECLFRQKLDFRSRGNDRKYDILQHTLLVFSQVSTYLQSLTQI